MHRLFDAAWRAELMESNPVSGVRTPQTFPRVCQSFQVSMMRVEHSLPAVYALYLADLVKRWQISTEALLAGSGLDETILVEPTKRITVRTCVRLLERARTLSGVPALGLFLGLQVHVSAHGFLGFAAVSASNVREALELNQTAVLSHTVPTVPLVTLGAS